MEVLRKRKKDKQVTVIRTVARIKKYPKGTKAEDIDAGIAKPYAVEEGVTDYADVRRD